MRKTSLRGAAAASAARFVSENRPPATAFARGLNTREAGAASNEIDRRPPSPAGVAFIAANGRKTSGGDESLDAHSFTDARVQKVVEYVDAHLEDELRLSDLAAVAGLSPHYFGGLFRAATGSPPLRYVMERRVERACELLTETDENVTTIAFELGFSSHSHFATMFRRLMRVTPSEFRATGRPTR